jgi:hypothetical protein
MNILHRSTHRGEGAAHQRLCTVKLDLCDNPVRLEIRDPETRAPVRNEINLTSEAGGYNKCGCRPSDTAFSFAATGGSRKIARLTIVRLSGSLANGAQRVRTGISHVGLSIGEYVRNYTRR